MHTCILGFLCPLRDVILRAPIGEHQANAGDPAGVASSLCLREAVLHHVLEGQARHRALLHVLHVHDGVLDLVRCLVHVQGELCAHAAGVLNQTDTRAFSRHVQGVHHLIDKLLHQLEVLRPHTLRPIDEEHQVNDG